ncbi:relaxase domain-containing protein [Microbacterium oleivorans]|uniref:relaxase domain-containing protein n=1 Tax=Microbacterium oleivorans TaxID=273677 RepID=UPI000B040A5F|nr:relaxase domain-containing protein [Microbacterium oleivorans]
MVLGTPSRTRSRARATPICPPRRAPKRRFIVDNGVITTDHLNAGGLRVWLSGYDPITGEERGHQRQSPDADLLLDGTLNHPKAFSLAALLHPELADEFEALQDRLRARILLTWQTELNARRGHGGLIREEITRIEVIELQHRRSRALDPHIRRHLWLNIKVLGVDASGRISIRVSR